MKSVFLWCIFASACYAVLVTCSEEESFDIGSILDNIPVEDRIGFLKYHLEIGYNLTKTGNTSDARDMRTKLSLQIYNYMIQNHKVENEELLDLLREIVCFDDGTCVDIGDVGIHPFR